MDIKTKVTVSSILADLSNGYTRTPKSKGYKEEGKSIMEKYSLTKTQIKNLFQHSQLKGKKSKFSRVLPFDLVDDITNTGIKPATLAEVTITTPKVKEFSLEPQY